MAIKRIRQANIGTTDKFVCDYEADKETIDRASFGDSVLVLESKNRYILDSHNNWELMTVGG